MTPRFGILYSIQLSYGCLETTIAEAGAARNRRGLRAQRPEFEIEAISRKSSRHCLYFSV